MLRLQTYQGLVASLTKGWWLPLPRAGGFPYQGSASAKGWWLPNLVGAPSWKLSPAPRAVRRGRVPETTTTPGTIPVQWI